MGLIEKKMNLQIKCNEFEKKNVIEVIFNCLINFLNDFDNELIFFLMNELICNFEIWENL